MLAKKPTAPSVLESLPTGGYRLSRDAQEAWDAARILNSIGEPGALSVKAKLFKAYADEAQAAYEAAEIVSANKWLVPPQHARPSSTMLALLVLCAVGTLAASVVAVADRFTERDRPTLSAPRASDAPLLPIDPPDPRAGEGGTGRDGKVIAKRMRSHTVAP